MTTSLAAAVADVVDVESGGKGGDGGSFSAKLLGAREGLRLGFKDVSLVLTTKGNKEKRILNNVSGSVRKGRLTAIMGPSGGGKTSLLNVLAARCKYSKGLSLTGTLSVNGQPIESYSWYRRQVAFVEQDDMLFGTLTVRETIEMAARLRLPRSMTPEERENRIQAVISELGLKKAANTRIGNARLRGISGGERKRVSVALEILQSPSVLMLDECTSGLDSFQALRVVSTLKDLALAGRTVVTSIHQPRSAIYALFDDLCLLSEGSLVYCGPTSKMLPHLAQVGGHKLPENYNPADFVLDLVALDTRSEQLEQESRARIDNLIQNAVTNAGEDFGVETAVSQQTVRGTHKYEASYPTQFLLLTQRGVRQKVRDPLVFVLQLAVSSFFGLLLGLVYFKTGENLSQTAIQDKSGLMFFMVLNQIMSGNFASIGTFPHERDIINRERAAKAYAVAPYYFSKFLVDLPNLVHPFVFVTLAFWLAAMRTDPIVYFNLLVLVLMGFLTATAMGKMFAALTPSQDAAQGTSMPVMLLFVLFSGFYANNNLVMDWLSWIQWISPMRWAFSAAVVNQFTGVVFECVAGSRQGCIPTGEAFIDRLGFAEDSVGRSVAVLAGMIAWYEVCGYLALRMKKRVFVVPLSPGGPGGVVKVVE